MSDPDHPTLRPTMRFPPNLLWPCLFLSALVSAPAPARAQTGPERQAAGSLVDYLLAQLEAREQSSNSVSGAGTSPLQYFDSEQQLRKLGPRASRAAPRVAAMLANSDRHRSALAWTLWAIAPEPSADELPSTIAALARSEGAGRLVQLAQLGRSRSPTVHPTLQTASAAPDIPARLLGAMGLGQQNDSTLAKLAVATLGTLLKDPDRDVRQAALNGLRQQGPRAAEVTAALIEHLRSRDNVFMTAQVLAFSPIADLMPVKPDLESLLSDSKLTAYQKQPIVALLLRIETRADGPASAATPPRLGAPGSAPFPSPGPIERRNGRPVNSGPVAV